MILSCFKIFLTFCDLKCILYANEAIAYTDRQRQEMTTTITTRVDDEYVKRIDEMAARKGVDRSALLRSFLLFALQEHTLREALEKYQEGKVTLWEAADQCNLSLWEMIHEIQQRHVHLPYGTRELEKDLRDL